VVVTVIVIGIPNNKFLSKITKQFSNFGKQSREFLFTSTEIIPYEIN